MIIEETVIVQTVEAGHIPEPLPASPAVYAKTTCTTSRRTASTNLESEQKTVEEWAGKFFHWMNKLTGVESDKEKLA
ncbi:hypothetical protein TWF281_003633 [Arthrobotrys megalospora]